MQSHEVIPCSRSSKFMRSRSGCIYQAVGLLASACVQSAIDVEPSAATSSMYTASGDGGAPVVPPTDDDWWIESAFPIGCRDDHIQIDLAADHRSFTAFTTLAASAPDSLVCHLYADVVVPEGKTFAVESVEVRGLSYIPRDYRTKITIVPGFVAQDEPSAQRNVVIAGPYDGPFVLKETFSEQELQFQNCTTRTRLRLAVVVRSAPAKGNAVASDAVVVGNATITQIGPVSLAVRDCPRRRP